VAQLRCLGASCAYGPVLAVDGLDLEVAHAETVALVGGPGAGKTTVVRMIAGIEPVASGRIEIGARDVTRAAPAARGVAVVYANAAPSGRLTIADHLELVAADAGAVAEAAGAVGLDGLHRRVDRLYPLERQLVAVARGLAARPAVLLLDDPTRGLVDDDARTFRTVVAGLGRTTLYTTRDPVEAAAVAARVAVLAGGRLTDVSAAATERARPASVRAAREFDPSLVVRTVQVGAWPYPAPATGALTVALPPEAAQLDAAGELAGTVLAAEGTTVYVALSGWDEPLPVRVAGSGLEYVGHRVRLRIASGAAQFFDPATGARLS
jgi:ABC-type sugar transport system ATPase subunit